MILIAVQVIGFLIAIVIFAIVTPVTEPIDGPWIAVAVALEFSAFYYIGSWFLLKRTPGMIPFHLYIVRAVDGSCVRAAGALVRSVGVLGPLWSWYLLLGFFDRLPVWAFIALLVVAPISTLVLIYIGVDKHKQGFHDKLARTFVIKTRTSTYDCSAAPAASTPLFGRGIAPARSNTLW
jgi:uncharacterized RDD family membrane protein YckC